MSGLLCLNNENDIKYSDFLDRVPLTLHFWYNIVQTYFKIGEFYIRGRLYESIQRSQRNTKRYKT